MQRKFSRASVLAQVLSCKARASALVPLCKLSRASPWEWAGNFPEEL